MADDHSSTLLARWRDGDQRAAAELFQRYADQLVALARSRPPAKLSSRLDAEDVVQSEQFFRFSIYRFLSRM